MKKFITILFCLSITLVGKVYATEDISEIMMSFYKKPTKDKTQKISKFLSSQSESMVYTKLGFYASLFKHHPKMFENALKYKTKNNAKSIISALYYVSKNKEAEKIKKEFNIKTYIDLKKWDKDICISKPTKEDLMFETHLLDYNWTRFFTTGKKEYVKKIINVLYACEKNVELKMPNKIIKSNDLLKQSAAWSLGANGKTKPLVVEAISETCLKLTKDNKEKERNKIIPQIIPYILGDIENIDGFSKMLKDCGAKKQKLN